MYADHLNFYYSMETVCTGSWDLGAHLQRWRSGMPHTAGAPHEGILAVPGYSSNSEFT